MVDDIEIRSLVAGVEQAERGGHPEEAARLLEQARAAAPEHPMVLNLAGLRALRAGDARGARVLFERAIAQDAASPVLLLNLAFACRALDDAPAELAALDRALALEPRYLLALLQKGSLLERQGKPRHAARVYYTALGSVTAATSVPPALKPALAHARDVLYADAAAFQKFLDERTADVRLRHAGARFERFDASIDALLGRSRIYIQQPTGLHYPRLPAVQFYDRADFPWLDGLEAATDDMRAEVSRVLREDAAELEPYLAHPEGSPLDQWQELNRSPRWSVFYLWREGRPVDEHLARCPRTAAALAQSKLIDVPGYAPTAFFSILAPRTRIPPHTGVTNTRLVVHVPLIIPPGCRFRVGSETREWRPGQAWVFDDTIEHEAWNDSDEPRIILICDTWNMYLTEAERDLLRATMPAITEFYEGVAVPPAGL